MKIILNDELFFQNKKILKKILKDCLIYASIYKDEILLLFIFLYLLCLIFPNSPQYAHIKAPKLRLKFRKRANKKTKQSPFRMHFMYCLQ